MKRLLLILFLCFMSRSLFAQNGATFHNGSTSIANFYIKCAATGYDSGKRTLAAGASIIIYDFYGPRTYTVECCGAGTTTIWTTSFNAPAPPYVTSCATIEVGVQAPPPKYKIDVDLTNNSDFPKKFDVDWTGDGVPDYTVTVPPHATNPLNLTFDTKPPLISVTTTSYGPTGDPINKTLSGIGPTSPKWYQEGGTSPGNVPVGYNPEVPGYDPSTANPNINFPDTSDLAKEATLRTGFNAERSTLSQGFQSVLDMMAYLGSKLSAFSSLAPTAEHIDTVAGQIKANTDNIRDNTQATAQNTVDIKNNTAASNTKLDGLGGKMDGIATSAATSAANSTTALGKYNEITGKIDTGNTKLEEIRQTSATSAQKLTEIAAGNGSGVKDSVDAMNAGLGSKLDSANTKLQVVADNTGACKDSLASILTSGQATKDQLAVINQYLNDHPWLKASDLETLRLAQVETKEQAHTDNVALQAKIDPLATAAKQDMQMTKQDVANDKLDTIKNEVANQGQRTYDQLAAGNSKLEDIKAINGGINTRLATVSLNIESIKSDTSHLPGIHGDTTAIKNSLPDLSDDVKAIRKHTQTLTNQFDDLLHWNTNVMPSIEGQMERYNGMKAQSDAAFDQLKSGFDVTGEYKVTASDPYTLQFLPSGWGPQSVSKDGKRVRQSTGALTGDFNPLHMPAFVSLFAFTRVLFKWLIAVGAIYLIFEWCHKAMSLSLKTPQIFSSSMVPGYSWVFKEMTVLIISAILLTLPMLIMNWVAESGTADVVKANPFNGWSGGVGAGIELFNAAFPIAYFVRTTCYLMLIRANMFATNFALSMAVKCIGL